MAVELMGRCGGIGLQVSTQGDMTLVLLEKSPIGAQCTFLIIHRDWQTEALEKLGEPFRKATIIRHWVRVSVSQTHGGKNLGLEC